MSRFAASFSAGGHGDGRGGPKRIPVQDLRLTRDELEQATEVFRLHADSGEFTMAVGVS